MECDAYGSALLTSGSAADFALLISESDSIDWSLAVAPVLGGALGSLVLWVLTRHTRRVAREQAAEFLEVARREGAVSAEEIKQKAEAEIQERRAEANREFDRREIESDLKLREIRSHEESLALLDFQFEVLTCFYNDGQELPERSAVNNGHAYIAAPYGIYKTGNGYLALAMGNILDLGRLLGCDALLAFTNPGDWFDKRDEIKSLLRDFLLTRSVKEWLAILEPADIWCAEVLDYDALKQEEGYTVLEMEQEVSIGDGLLKTTRCPIRVDGELLNSPIGAPALGEHTAAIKKEFNL